MAWGTAPRMAERFWPGRDAVGGRFRIGGDWLTVIGVARDAVYRDLGERAAPWFFLIKGLLLGVQPWDPLTLVVVLLVLGGSSALSCLAPAWRAASTDPVRALRAE